MLIHCDFATLSWTSYWMTMIMICNAARDVDVTFHQKHADVFTCQVSTFWKKIETSLLLTFEYTCNTILHCIVFYQSIQPSFFLLYVWYSSTPWLYVILPHFSRDRSNWSSPSFSSTTFENFPGISDLLFEVSSFQHHKMLCSKCSTSLASSLISVQSASEKSLLPLNAAFAMTILDLISREHLASFVIMLPKKLKNSTFPSRFWFLVICTRDGSLEILITSDFPNYLRNKLAKKEKTFVRKKV